MKISVTSAALGAIAMALSCPGFAAANTLDAPNPVEAAADGSFSYEAVFTASDDVVIQGFTLIGLNEDNVNFGIILADCFCPPGGGCPVAMGEEFLIPVGGSLLDPAQPGLVTVSVQLCTGESFEVETTITPFDGESVPTTSTWGLVVLCLSLAVAGKLRGERWKSMA